jgi:hypothetical protein
MVHGSGNRLPSRIHPNSGANEKLPRRAVQKNAGPGFVALKSTSKFGGI